MGDLPSNDPKVTKEEEISSDDIGMQQENITKSDVVIQRDTMDGGFAVVDRERIIEAEVRDITPWYKHFIHAFIAPTAMMEECFTIEPTKGASVGVVGGIIFSALYALLNLFNPVNKRITYETLRLSGIEETSLEQSFSISVISGCLGTVIGFFLGALLTTITYQIIKALLKDKAKFSTIYKMSMVASMVIMAVQCVDAIAAWMIGVSGNVFSVTWLLSEEIKMTPIGSVLVSSLTLPNVIYLIYLVIGYKVITHTSIKKGIVVAAINEIITIVILYGMASITLNMTAGM